MPEVEFKNDLMWYEYINNKSDDDIIYYYFPIAGLPNPDVQNYDTPDGAIIPYATLKTDDDHLVTLGECDMKAVNKLLPVLMGKDR